MNYEFKAKSSGEEPYHVAFTFDNRKLSINCNCKAGIFGKLCKHKVALLTGDSNMLADTSESASLQELLAQVSSTAYPQLLKQVHADEVLVDDAKKALKKSKKTLEQAMKNGA